MPELPSLHEATVDAIVGRVGGATLPFQEAAGREGSHATLFWFNELVESTPDGDVVRQYLVTAGEPTRGVEFAEVTIRPALCDPAPSAEKLVITDFAEGWTHLGDLGVAMMPSADLHAYAGPQGLALEHRRDNRRPRRQGRGHRADRRRTRRSVRPRS
ncbi:hypothetical protein ACRAWF_29530 [Streptomyces sp. L7]